MTSITLVDVRDTRRYSATENLGLASIAAHLRRDGVPTTLRVLDIATNPQSLTWWANEAAIGFALFHDNVHAIREVSHRIKETHPEIRIFVGGRFATEIASEVLRDFPDVDAVVLGDGERVVADLANLVRDGRPLAGLEGLRTREAMFSQPAFESAVEERPARDFAFSSSRPAAVARLVGKRGCTGTCAFCMIGSSRERRKRKLRLRSPESLLDEALALRTQFGVRAFMIHDCPFNEPGPHGVARIERFCSLVCKLPETMAFECLLDGRYLCHARPDFARTMLDAGFSQVMMLLGSGNEADRIRLGKRGPLADVEASIALFEQQDIEVMLEFFMLHPWSTQTTLAQNFAFLQRRSAYRLAYYIRRAPLYRGTSLGQAGEAQGLLRDPNRYDLPFDYHFMDPAVQKIADALDRLENTQAVQLDTEFQDIVYLFNWLRVLFPQETTPLQPMFMKAKASAQAKLTELFEPLGQGAGAQAVPTPEAMDGALVPIYSETKALQMRLLRIPCVRQYLLRTVDARGAVAG
jgi:hypothetical protein